MPDTGRKRQAHLNDEVLRNLYERLTYLRNLEDKKAAGAGQYRGAGQADGRTESKIEAAETLVVVEDLYRPYRPEA